MRFGIFSVADHYPTELRRSATELYGELLDQAEAADALGFDSFWIAEHHFHEYGAIPRPPVWLAAAAERTRRIRPYAVQRREAAQQHMVDAVKPACLLNGDYVFWVLNNTYNRLVPAGA